MLRQIISADSFVHSFSSSVMLYLNETHRGTLNWKNLLVRHEGFIRGDLHQIIYTYKYIACLA